MKPEAALVCIDMLEARGWSADAVADALLAVQAEDVEQLRWGAPVVDFSGGAFGRMSAAGWDVYLANGRWIAYGETAEEAETKLAEWRELFGSKA